MRDGAASAALQVIGVGAVVPSAPGPGLLGTSNWSLVLMVSAPDDGPVSGLAREAFAIVALVSDRDGAAVWPLHPSSVVEPVAGVYSFRFATDTIRRVHATHVPCVVDVTDARDQRVAHGRTLVQLGT